MSDLDFSTLSPGELKDALDGPALPPPNGILSDFDNPRNHNKAGLAGLVICLTVSTVFLFIRLYMKLFKLKQPHIVECKYCL